MTYDLVVFGYSADYLPIFTELEVRQNIHLIQPFWRDQSELLRCLCRIDFAFKKRKLPTFLHLDHRYPGEPQISEEINTPVCLIFFRDWYPLFASGYIKKMKELAPHTKACWFFSDLVSTYPGINIEGMRSEFDLILSFDPEDAKRYGFVHCPLPYCALPKAEKRQRQAMRSDVFFMGSAKLRLDMILAVYKRLQNSGLVCDFHVVGVPSKEQQYTDEINYCDFIPYVDYLQMALSSRCILELLQDPAHHGYTARTCEALVYGQKLLSNNTNLIFAPFYDPRQIGLFSRPEEININFITDQWQPERSPILFSPRYTLELIEERLNIRFSAGKSSFVAG